MFIFQNELKIPNNDVKDNVMQIILLMCQVDHLDSHFLL